MIVFGDLNLWFGVFAAFFATFFWRLLGLILVERISSSGLFMRWINAVAYALVAGVLMVILINPTGILLSSPLKIRLLGLVFGIVTVYLTKNLFFSIIVGMGFFTISSYF